MMLMHLNLQFHSFYVHCERIFAVFLHSIKNFLVLLPFNNNFSQYRYLQINKKLFIGFYDCLFFLGIHPKVINFNGIQIHGWNLHNYFIKLENYKFWKYQQYKQQQFNFYIYYRKKCGKQQQLQIIFPGIDHNFYIKLWFFYKQLY